MQLTFYHYVHCPFCVRVRMGLGLLRLPYQSVVVPYNDEKTPVALTGKKMLPIMVIDGKAINESLDILAALDLKNRFKLTEITVEAHFAEFNELLNQLGSNIHNLAMPYWIWTPEFDDLSRTYFQKKKEVKRGPFKDLIKKREQFLTELLKDLAILSHDLRPFYRSEALTVYDILLASHLWGLYIVPEFQFPEQVHSYLQRVKNMCHFDYHEDFWR